MDSQADLAGGSVEPRVRVCPDCGSPAGAQPFCASCGRNLSMIERLPTRAEWDRDGASATPAPPEAATLATTVADAFLSIRTWHVPLDRRSRPFRDSAVQDRLRLSVQDHVAQAIRFNAGREMPVEIAISVESDKRAYLAASVPMPGKKALEQRFAASARRAQAEIYPVGSVNLVDPDGEVIPSFGAQAANVTKPPKPESSGLTRTKGCLSLIVLGVILVVAISTISSSGGKSKTPQQNAQTYIKSMGRDMNTVQVSVQSVQAGLLILQKDGATSDAVNQFAQVAQQAHDSIDAVRQDFATGDTGGNLGNAEVELFTAANDLKNAMGAVVAYTGNPNPATLAHFTSQYQPAVAEWNDGVRGVWSIAGESKPPTL